MTQENNILEKPVHTGSFTKPVLIGAGIGLIVISFFVFGVDMPRPEWGKFWMIRPLIVTPLAGATGGLCYYFLDYIRYRGGWRKVVANILSFFIFVIGIWMGIVLGLAGTMWH